MNRFGNFLKKEIARNKLSQNKFAKEIGVSSYYVGQLIKGEKRPPSRELQTKIANVLNFDESKKIQFFNIIAKEKSDIPSDIYNGVINNEPKYIIANSCVISVPPTVELRNKDDEYNKQLKNIEWKGFKINRKRLYEFFVSRC